MMFNQGPNYVQFKTPQRIRKEVVNIILGEKWSVQVGQMTVSEIWSEHNICDVVVYRSNNGILHGCLK